SWGAAVEVVVGGVAAFPAGEDEGRAALGGLAVVGAGGGPAPAVERVGAAALRFRFLEIGQHVRIAPADIAKLAPVVEILPLSADIEQAVDGAAAAQHLAPGLHDISVVELGLGRALIEPVDPRIRKKLTVADGNVN